MSNDFTLIIDDGAPVNLAFFLHPPEKSEFKIPNRFTQQFARLIHQYGIRGKFSVVPMPSMLGRIDHKLNYVSKAHLNGFLKIIREQVKPSFDITAEILTHQDAYLLKEDRFFGMREDDWIAQATVGEMTEYFVLANRILKKVGLAPNGMTSPWSAGINNESDYAHAVGNAQWQVFRRKFVWYFLHWSCDKTPEVAWVTYRNRTRGQVVVALCGNCPDAFWTWKGHRYKRQQVAAVRKGVDQLLSRDGKSGRIRELADQGLPIILVTHWQGLFANGTGIGLEGLEDCASRIRRIFGSSVCCRKCSDVARAWSQINQL